MTMPEPESPQRWVIVVEFEGTGAEVAFLVHHVSQQRGISQISAQLADFDPKLKELYEYRGGA